MLTPGSNVALASAQASWTLESSSQNAFGSTAAVALIPMDDKRAPRGAAALFHVEQTSWMSWSGDPAKVACTLQLGSLPTGSDRLLLVVYRYSNLGPLSTLGVLKLQINGTVCYDFDAGAVGESALILGEFYSRGGQWKFRAMAEGSAYGLAAFGRRLNLEIDETNPEHPASESNRPRPGHNGSCATGTGFAVSSNALLTCAHVIEGMSSIEISSFNGRSRAEPVMVDVLNDIALLRVEGVALQPVLFSGLHGAALGDSVTAIGFPMSGFAGGGAHVTQGGVSALLGLRNDASLLQFTAAIQPGSSGSPLFDSRGSVVGMVTSTVTDAQNMNFAVKSHLLNAFMEACNIQIQRQESSSVLTPSEIARSAQASLWKIEAR